MNALASLITFVAVFSLCVMAPINPLEVGDGTAIAAEREGFPKRTIGGGTR
jgi:hypothetical protein